MPGLTWIDIAALAWFLLCAGGYSYATRYGTLAKGGLVGAINEQRKNWMANMAERDNRMVDVQVLAALARGNAFFASTAVFVTGALAALFGTVEELHALATKFPFLRQTTVFMWQLKVLFLMSVFILAFFQIRLGVPLSPLHRHPDSRDANRLGREQETMLGPCVARRGSRRHRRSTRQCRLEILLFRHSRPWMVHSSDRFHADDPVGGRRYLPARIPLPGIQNIEFVCGFMRA